jgi:hypothetical protein
VSKNALHQKGNLSNETGDKNEMKVSVHPVVLLQLAVLELWGS